MRLADAHALAVGLLPVRGERDVDVFVELARRVVGDVQQRDFARRPLAAGGSAPANNAAARKEARFDFDMRRRLAVRGDTGSRTPVNRLAAQAAGARSAGPAGPAPGVLHAHAARARRSPPSHARAARAEVVQPIYRPCRRARSRVRRARRRCRGHARPAGSSRPRAAIAPADPIARHARIRSRAVDHAVHQPGARACGAARPPDHFDHLVQRSQFLQPAGVYLEDALAFERAHRRERAGRRAMSIHIPVGARMPQETCAFACRDNVRQIAGRRGRATAKTSRQSPPAASTCRATRAAGASDATRNRHAARPCPGLRAGRESLAWDWGSSPWRDSTWMRCTRGRMAASLSAASIIVRPLPSSNALSMFSCAQSPRLQGSSMRLTDPAMDANSASLAGGALPMASTTSSARWVLPSSSHSSQPAACAAVAARARGDARDASAPGSCATPPPAARADIRHIPGAVDSRRRSH